MRKNRLSLPSPDSAMFVRLVSTFITSALAVLLALAVGAIFILLSNQDPIHAYSALVEGAFGNRRALGETLVLSTPMILGGLSFAIAARASMFNIGIEGQIVIGSLAGALVAAGNLGLPGIVYVPLCLVVGALAGGLWGAIPGVMKAKSGASEVISTIMLNYLAFRVSTYMVTSAGEWLSLVEPQQLGTKRAVPEAKLPIIFDGTRLNAGFPVAIGAAVIFWYLLFRTTFGYRIRTVGLSRGAAAFAGIGWGATITLAMFLSGALAGMAGTIEAIGLNGRHYGAPAGYGFTAIAVGLVGRNHPFGVIFAGLLFGMLRSGSTNMQSQAGASKDLILILQGLVILAISALAAVEQFRARRAQKAAVARPQQSPSGAPA